MGEIIKSFLVRSTTHERPRSLRFLFDTGALKTFVRQGAVKDMRGLLKLPEPKRFGGLGNGAFHATHLVDLEVRLLRTWCHEVAYVVPDEVLEEAYDVLAGDEFMQAYHIEPVPHRRNVRLDPVAIRLSQRTRSQVKSMPLRPPRTRR